MGRVSGAVDGLGGPAARARLEIWLADALDAERVAVEAVEPLAGGAIQQNLALPLPAVPDGHGLVLVHASADGSSVVHGIDASGRVHGAPADRLDALKRITDYALAVFRDDGDAARRWFDATIRALGSRRPVDCLDSAAGRELVLDTLGAIEHGHVM